VHETGGAKLQGTWSLKVKNRFPLLGLSWSFKDTWSQRKTHDL